MKLSSQIKPISYLKCSTPPRSYARSGDSEGEPLIISGGEGNRGRC